MEYFRKQYSMYYNPIPHNLNHHHLKNDVDTQLTVALLTFIMNWIYYTKSLRTCIRNSLLLYTINQINTTPPLYRLLSVNAMKHQLTLERNHIFTPSTYASFNPMCVNAHAEVFLHETLLKMILTTKKVLKNFFLIFQALAFNTLFVLVTPLQSPPTRKEAHQFLQMSTLRHMTLSCWMLRTFCPHPSPRWYWHLQYPSQFAKCKHRPSWRWPNLLHSNSLWIPQIIRGWAHCLHPPPLPRAQMNFTCT